MEQSPAPVAPGRSGRRRRLLTKLAVVLGALAIIAPIANSLSDGPLFGSQPSAAASSATTSSGPVDNTEAYKAAGCWLFDGVGYSSLSWAQVEVKSYPNKAERNRAIARSVKGFERWCPGVFGQFATAAASCSNPSMEACAVLAKVHS